MSNDDRRALLGILILLAGNFWLGFVIGWAVTR